LAELMLDAAGADTRETFARIRTHMSPGQGLGQKLMGRNAVEVSGEGAVVTLSNGREVIDFGSYGVALLGHRPSGVVAAVERQLAELPASTRVLANTVAPALASRLVELTDPARLSRVWLGQDGADAVEAALKLARVATGRQRVLALRGGFHGKTLGALAVTSSTRYRSSLEPLLGPAAHIADDLADARRELARGQTAAVILEPVQGEGGVRALDPGFLEDLVRVAREAGAFVISDEVQVGLRRCGPVSLAVELGLDPDAVLFGKHLGGGVMPISALVCSNALYAPAVHDPFLHSATFSGHPLSCAAALAALDAIEEQAGRGAELAASIERELEALARRHPRLLVEVHGLGLAWGLEFTTPQMAGEVLAELAPAGLLVSPCLGRAETIRLLPPIVTTDEQLAAAVDVLDSVFRMVMPG
jgi:putrescine aminotransferase